MVVPNCKGAFFPCFANLVPLTYDETLSYYEQLIAVINRLNTMQESLTEFETNLDELITAQINQKINPRLDEIELNLKTDLQKMKNDILTISGEMDIKFNELSKEFDNLENSMIKNFDNFVIEINTKLNKFQDEWTKRLVNIENQMLEIHSLINANYDFLTKLIEAKYQLMYEKLLEMICQTTGDKIYVKNPFTGHSDTLNNTLQEVLQLGWTGGITAEEYKRMKMPAEVYQSYKITAYDYRYRARWIFFDWLYLKPIKEQTEKQLQEFEKKWIAKFEKLEKTVHDNSVMRSPFTGEITDIKLVINELADLHKVGLTAEQYDALNIKASEYDDKNISAYIYDWEGRMVLEP